MTAAARTRSRADPQVASGPPTAPAPAAERSPCRSGGARHRPRDRARRQGQEQSEQPEDQDRTPVTVGTSAQHFHQAHRRPEPASAPPLRLGQLRRPLTVNAPSNGSKGNPDATCIHKHVHRRRGKDRPIPSLRVLDSSTRRWGGRPAHSHHVPGGSLFWCVSDPQGGPPRSALADGRRTAVLCTGCEVGQMRAPCGAAPSGVPGAGSRRAPAAIRMPGLTGPDRVPPALSTSADPANCRWRGPSLVGGLGW